MITVGSTAAKYWLPKFREPQDMDVWAHDKERVIDFKGMDLSIMPIEIMNLIESENGFATLDSLLTIKMAHLGWDILWEKHFRDIQALKAAGAKLVPYLFEVLYAHWQKTHKDKPYLSLYQRKGDFFNDHVDYTYDHDFLHECVSDDSEPLYRKCLQDGQEVMIDRSKFAQMSREEKINMFKEEITVIAFERWIIPRKTDSWKKAYKWALRKTLTSLTKGWATKFCISNIFELKEPNLTYIKNIASKIKEGDVIMESENLKKVFEDMSKDIYDMEPADIIVNLCYDAADNDNYMVWDVEDLPELVDEVSDFRARRDAAERAITALKEKYQFKLIESKSNTDEYEGDYSCVFEVLGVTYRIEFDWKSYSGPRPEGALETLRKVTQVEKTVMVWE